MVKLIYPGDLGYQISLLSLYDIHSSSLIPILKKSSNQLQLIPLHSAKAIYVGLVLSDPVSPLCQISH